MISISASRIKRELRGRPHIERAVEQLNMSNRAFERAKLGARWLDVFAPADWRLQMISINNGVVTSEVRMSYDTRGPLALAFRRCPEMRRGGDRVLNIDVLEQLRLSNLQAEGFGFWSTTHHTRVEAAEVLISAHLDGLFLDEAWASVLKEMPHREIVPVYPTKIAAP